MHGKRRYVKLAWIGLVSVLALPAPAKAEIVAPTTSDGLLAVAADGSPRVAYLSGRDLVLEQRSGTGWIANGLGRAPAGAVLFGLVVDGAGRSSVLVEADDGAWLALASRGRPLRVVARPAKGSSFGPAGLTLDAAGRPAFAYAVRRRSTKTFLRLVTTDTQGRLRTHPITKGGFPSSTLVPGAVPVVVHRTLHVVETFSNEAIDWGPKRGGGWEGQYLYASRCGSPQGKVGAAASGANLWSSWTEMTGDGPIVLLTLTADASGDISGRVTGATSGVVQIYRELGSAGRAPIGNAELAPDGTFSVQDVPPASPTLYRAVYVDPATGIPYAALLRTPVGPG